MFNRKEASSPLTLSQWKQRLESYDKEATKTPSKLSTDLVSVEAATGPLRSSHHPRAH